MPPKPPQPPPAASTALPPPTTPVTPVNAAHAPRVAPTLASVLAWPPGQAPWAKQEESFAQTVDEPIKAVFMEQRTGKCAVVLGKTAKRFSDFLNAGGFGPPDSSLDLPNEYPKARHLDKFKPIKERPAAWVAEHIDALLVVSMPSGVSRSAWAPETKLRLPPALQRRVLIWDAGKSSQKSFLYEFEDLLRFRGLACLFVNGEAIITDAFRKLAARFMKIRRVLAVGDETTEIMKSPGTKRARVMDGIAARAYERLILDGTPVGEGPFDLYQQFKFLDPKIIGMPDFQTFKHRYAEWEKKTFFDTKKQIRREYPAIKENDVGEKCYQNLDELNAKIAPYVVRVLRKDCFDVPDKLYLPRRFALSDEQRRVYDALAEEYEAELSDTTVVSASHVLARYTRLQQIGSNYWPSIKTILVHDACKGEGCAECDDLGVVEGQTTKKVIDTKTNPRLDVLTDVLNENRSEAGIVWARFSEDIEMILAHAHAMGRRAVRYDGKVNDIDKDAAKRGFQDGTFDLFVANARAAGRGIDLSAAGFHVYYSNGFPLLQRLQSEDRTEVAGRAKGTGVYDLIAENTVDETIVTALVNKCSVADHVMRNSKREWFK